MSSADCLCRDFPRVARLRPKMLDGQSQANESLGLNLSRPLIGFADNLISNPCLPLAQMRRAISIEQCPKLRAKRKAYARIGTRFEASPLLNRCSA
jgi:hypothetical protein